MTTNSPDKESNTDAPRRPIFVALDRADRLAAVRKVFTAAGIRCESIELSDSENLCVDFSEPGRQLAGSARVWPEGDALALEIRAWAPARPDGNYSEANAPSVGLALLQLGLQALEILGSWDGTPGAHLLPGDKLGVLDAEPPETTAAEFLLSVWPTFEGDPRRGLQALALHLRADPKWREIIASESK